MKKQWKGVLALIAVISACTYFTACKDEPVNVTMQEIYDANATATLLQAYDEVGIVYTGVGGSVKKTYLDGEIYQETVTLGENTVSECYNKAGTIGYVLQGGAYYAMLAKSDVLNAKPKTAYENQVFADKALALQEEIVSAVNKDGKVQVRTKLSVENSVGMFEENGYNYRDDEYIQTDYVLEKDTYRVLTAKRIAVRASGATAPFTNLEQKFDVSVTTETANLKARVQAVGSGTNVRKMTVAMDPNTISEELCSAFAVMGDRFQISLGERYVTFYTDSDCKNEYVFDEGDVRKQFLKLYTKKVFLPVECDFTMQDIIDANDIKAWLNAYSSVTVELHDVGQNKKSIYYDNEKIYGKETNATDGIVSDSVMLADFSLVCEKRGDIYRVQLGYDVSDVYNRLRDYIDVEEVMQDVQEKSGKLYLTTRLDNPFEADKYWESEYVLNARTHRIESYKGYETYADGTRALIRTVDVKVNEEMPAEGAQLYQHLTATENVREVVVLVNPGTADMEVRRFHMVKGDKLDDGVYGLYTDFACTQKFEDGEPYEDDLLLYAELY